jgi:hypothetical protein
MRSKSTSFGKQLLERIDGIQGSPFDADSRLDTPCDSWVGRKEAGHAGQQCRETAPWSRGPAFETRPEIVQPLKAIGALVAGDDGAIDGANRRADHPVRLDARFVHRLVDTRLIAPGGAAALHDQHDLARQRSMLRRDGFRNGMDAFA